MKFIWEESDVKSGVFFHGGSTENTQFMASTLCKISYCNFLEDRKIFATSMTDGMVYEIGDTEKEAADYLNKQGYMPTSPEQIISVIQEQHRNMRLFRQT